LLLLLLFRGRDGLWGFVCREIDYGDGAKRCSKMKKDGVEMKKRRVDGVVKKKKKTARKDSLACMSDDGCIDFATVQDKNIQLRR
jgi:hypothetical protein